MLVILKRKSAGVKEITEIKKERKKKIKSRTNDIHFKEDEKKDGMSVR